MLTALAAFHSDSDLQTVLQLLRTGDVNAKASQVRPLLAFTYHSTAVSEGIRTTCGFLCAGGADSADARR